MHTLGAQEPNPPSTPSDSNNPPHATPFLSHQPAFPINLRLHAQHWLLSPRWPSLPTSEDLRRIPASDYRTSSAARREQPKRPASEKRERALVDFARFAWLTSRMIWRRGFRPLVDISSTGPLKNESCRVGILSSSTDSSCVFGVSSSGITGTPTTTTILAASLKLALVGAGRSIRWPSAAADRTARARATAWILVTAGFTLEIL
mmetsp:Transcript_28116/g.76030  ORF Transcript_28116/g.76030 Transcript_28116/m.76030 type:complete len:205 (-) Transcript_28116:265-879(-)